MSDRVPGPVPATATQAAAEDDGYEPFIVAEGWREETSIRYVPESAVAEAAAHAAAAERAAIQAHLRDVVTDHVPQGNDYVLGALLDAIRELVALDGAESPGGEQ